MSSQSAPGAEHRSLWGPACGVLFVVLLVVSLSVFATPSTSKSPQYLLNWYSNSTHKREVLISTVLADIAVVFGMFWFGYLRDRFSRSDLGTRLSPILFGGAILFAGGGLGFSGTQIALADDPKKMEPATAQTLNFLATDIGIGGSVAGISIIMLAAAFIILRSKVLPQWLAWVSFVLGVVALAGPVGFFAFLATGLWILIVAFLMWRFERDLPVSEGASDRPSVTASSTPG